MHLAPPCRSQKDESLPLKRGMLRYAHTRQLPVQVRWLWFEWRWKVAV